MPEQYIARHGILLRAFSCQASCVFFRFRSHAQRLGSRHETVTSFDNIGTRQVVAETIKNAFDVNPPHAQAEHRVGSRSGSTAESNPAIPDAIVPSWAMASDRASGQLCYGKHQLTKQPGDRNGAKVHYDDNCNFRLSVLSIRGLEEISKINTVTNGDGQKLTAKWSWRARTNSDRSLPVVSLFSGAGGLDPADARRVSQAT